MSTSQEIANRALKYEHARQLKRLNDELSNTFKITVKELRCKLQLEKCRDLTKQKDDINRKHGVEIKKLAKSHEVREQKLSSELTRLREERGSTSARGQRSTDILDGQLRVTRASADRSQKKCRQLEARLVEYKSTEVQRSRECNLQRHASDKKIKELRRNGELEIRKLMSELKSRDKIISNLNLSVPGNAFSQSSSPLDMEHSIFPWSEDVLQPSPETTPATETAETDTLVDSNVRKLDAEEERAVGEGKKREGEEKDGKEDMERIARVPGDGTDTSGEQIRGQEIIRENPMNSSFTSVSTDDDSSSQNTSDQGQPDIVRQTRTIFSKDMKNRKRISDYKDYREKLRVSNETVARISRENIQLRETINIQNAFALKNKENVVHLENTIKGNLTNHLQDMNKLTEQISEQDNRIEVISKKFRNFKLHITKKKAISFIMPTLYENKTIDMVDITDEEDINLLLRSHSQFEDNYKTLSKDYVTLQRDFRKLYDRPQVESDRQDQKQLEEVIAMETTILDYQVVVERLQDKICDFETKIQTYDDTLKEKSEEIEILEFRLFESQDKTEAPAFREPEMESLTSLTPVTSDFSDENDDYTGGRVKMEQMAAMLDRERVTVDRLHAVISRRDSQIEQLTKDNRSMSAALQEVRSRVRRRPESTDALGLSRDDVRGGTTFDREVYQSTARSSSSVVSPESPPPPSTKELVLADELQRLRRQLERVENDCALRQRNAREDGQRVGECSQLNIVKELSAKLEISEIQLQDKNTEFSRINDLYKITSCELDKVEKHSKCEIEKLQNLLEECKCSLQIHQRNIQFEQDRCKSLEQEMRENRMKSLTLNEIVADLEQKEVRRETMEHCLQRENKQLRTVISVKERSPLCSRHRSPSPLPYLEDYSAVQAAQQYPSPPLPPVAVRDGSTVKACKNETKILMAERDTLKAALTTLRSSVCRAICDQVKHEKDDKTEDSDIVTNLNKIKERTNILEKQLRFAESSLIKQEKQHQDEIIIMEKKSLDILKREAKLRNELKYSCKITTDDFSTPSSSLAKIQHLEELVFDLEASEHSLQRELCTVNCHETNLQRQMVELKSVQDKMKSPANCEVESLKNKLTRSEQSERIAIMNANHLQVDLDKLLLDNDHFKLERNLTNQSKTLEFLEQQMTKLNVELEDERQKSMEKSKEDHSTIHELSIELHSAKLAESTMIRRIQDIEQSKQSVQTELFKSQQLHEQVSDSYEKLLADKKILDHQFVDVKDLSNKLEYQLSSSEDNLKSVEKSLLNKKRDLEKMTKENEIIHNEIDVINAELESNKLKYQHELKSYIIKQTILQKELEELQKLESLTQMSLLERDNEVNMLSGRLLTSSGNCGQLRNEINENGSIIVQLQKKLSSINNQDRVHIRCLERDVIYERSRAEELTAELSRCHSDVFTLRERVAAAEQCRRRQQALVEGVSMVTEVNKRYNVKQVDEASQDMYNLVDTPSSSSTYSVQCVSSKSEMEDSVSVMLESEEDEDDTMITSRHIDSGLGSSALKEGFIDHPRYDSNISRSVPIVDIQNLVNEFKVTDRNDDEVRINVEEYFSCYGNDLSKDISKLKNFFKNGISSENYKILKAYFMELLQICVYTQKCTDLYNNERMILRKENLALVQLNRNLKIMTDTGKPTTEFINWLSDEDDSFSSSISITPTRLGRVNHNSSNESIVANHSPIKTLNISIAGNMTKKLAKPESAEYKLDGEHGSRVPRTSVDDVADDITMSHNFDFKHELRKKAFNDVKKNSLVIHPGYMTNPDPPTSCFIQKIGREQLKLKWKSPLLDIDRKNNGFVIKGYRINLDYKKNFHLKGVENRTLLLDDLNLDVPHNICIFAITDGDISSRALYIQFEANCTRMRFGRGSIARRMFITMYDYNPKEYVPLGCPGERPRFDLGEMVCVFGVMTVNGYYYGQIRNEKGYFPASFLHLIYGQEEFTEFMENLSDTEAEGTAV